VDIIYRFISRFHHSLLLLIYLTLSMLLMLSSDSRLVEGIRSAALESFGVIFDAYNSATSYFNLRDINSHLQLQNTRLAYENSQLQDALLENRRLRRLLQFKYDVEYDLIPAKVVGFSPHDFVSGLLLSSGDLQKFHKNSAVMVADGLVGKIVKITGSHAICQILMDPNSRVSVRIQRNRELGIVSWDGENQLKLDHIPNTISVQEGDVLLTSGFSQIYPPGIKVGVITRFNKNDEGLFQDITVRPSVNFNRLEEVFVLESREPDAPRN
jgi:rod shape-determining protein MreC